MIYTECLEIIWGHFPHFVDPLTFPKSMRTRKEALVPKQRERKGSQTALKS